MDFEEINQILAMMREHELSEFELERQGLKIRIKKEAGHMLVAPPQVVMTVRDRQVSDRRDVLSGYRAGRAAVCRGR